MRITREDRITAVLANLVKVPLGGWMLMLGIGVAHNEWWPAVPPIGFWWALALYALLPYGNGAYAREMAMDREGRENEKAHRAMRANPLGRALYDLGVAARRGES